MEKQRLPLKAWKYRPLGETRSRETKTTVDHRTEQAAGLDREDDEMMMMI